MLRICFARLKLRPIDGMQVLMQSFLKTKRLQQEQSRRRLEEATEEEDVNMYTQSWALAVNFNFDMIDQNCHFCIFYSMNLTWGWLFS